MSMRTVRSVRMAEEAGSGVSAVYHEQKYRVNDAKAEPLRQVGG